MSALRKVARFTTTLPRVAARGLNAIFGRADHRRWADQKNLEEWWDTRTEMLASLVPAGSRTLDFGAGKRRLERFLPPGCVYFASDLTDRGPGTIVCDLNARPRPDLAYLKADVAVFGGVLEYLHDLPDVARWLTGQARTVVLSYDCVTSPTFSRARLAELFRRYSFGYMSHCTREELAEAFENAGFRCMERGSWQNQDLFVFQSQPQTTEH